MTAKVTRRARTREPRPPAAGSDAVALLLPGMTMNETIFPDVGFPSVALDFNDLALGPDGAGESGREGRMDLYVRMLRDALADTPQWGGTRRIVVAHSFGGMLALQWLIADEGHDLAAIDGLVLCCTTAGPMFHRARLRLHVLGTGTVRVPVAPLLPLWNLPAVTRAVKRVVCGDLRVERVDFRRLPDQTDLALDLAGWCNTDWRAMRSYRLAMEGFDVRAELHRIIVPTVVLHGTRDTLFPVSVARELADGLPNAQLRIVRGAGHGLPLTHGAWIQRAVNDLAGSDRPGRVP